MRLELQSKRWKMTNQTSTNTPFGDNQKDGDSQKDTIGQDAAVGKLREVAEAGKSEASRLGQEVKFQTSNLVDEASVQVRDRAETQLGRIAGMLDQLGNELRRMADGASDRDNYVAVLARDGAAAAKRISTRLELDGIEGAARDLKQFARRRPMAFLAGAVTVGMAMGRLTRNVDMGRIASAASDDHSSIDLSRNQPRMPAQSGMLGTAESAPVPDTASSAGTLSTAGVGWATPALSPEPGL